MMLGVGAGVGVEVGAGVAVGAGVGVGSATGSLFPQPEAAANIVPTVSRTTIFLRFIMITPLYISRAVAFSPYSFAHPKTQETAFFHVLRSCSLFSSVIDGEKIFSIFQFFCISLLPFQNPVARPAR